MNKEIRNTEFFRRLPEGRFSKLEGLPTHRKYRTSALKKIIRSNEAT